MPLLAPPRPRRPAEAYLGITPVAGRRCGACSVCCIAFAASPDPDGIPAKAAGQWCAHLAACGTCAIYARRPGMCRGYECLWLQGLGDESQRPDRAGVLVDCDWVDVEPRDMPVLRARTPTPGRLPEAKTPEMTAALDRAYRQGIALVLTGPRGELTLVLNPAVEFPSYRGRLDALARFIGLDPRRVTFPPDWR